MNNQHGDCGGRESATKSAGAHVVKTPVPGRESGSVADTTPRAQSPVVFQSTSAASPTAALPAQPAHPPQSDAILSSDDGTAADQARRRTVDDHPALRVFDAISKEADEAIEAHERLGWDSKCSSPGQFCSFFSGRWLAIASSNSEIAKHRDTFRSLVEERLNRKLGQ